MKEVVKLLTYRDWVMVQASDECIASIKYMLDRFESVKSEYKDDEEKVDPDLLLKLYKTTQAGFVFLSGILDYVVEGLSRSYEVTIVRNWEPINYGVVTSDILPGIILRDYQVASCNKALRDNKSLISLPTRSGKTEVGIAVLKKFREIEPDSKAIFVFPSSLIMKQTYKKLIDRGFLNVGRVGDGFKEVHGNTTLSCVKDSLASAAERQSGELYEFVKDAKFVFWDEVHLFGSKSYIDVWMLVVDPLITIFTSGTPFFDRVSPLINKHDAFLIGVSGGVSFSLSYQYLCEKGYLAEANVFFVEYMYKRQSFMVKSYHNAYTRYIVKSKGRNYAASVCAQELYARHFKTLLLVKILEHGRQLLSYITPWCPGVVFANGDGVEYLEDGKFKRKPDDYDAVDEFNKGNVPILIG